MPERCGPCSYHQFSVGTFHLDPLQGLEMVHIIIWGLAVIRRATAVSAMVDFGQFDPNLLGASNLNNSNDLNSGNSMDVKVIHYTLDLQSFIISNHRLNGIVGA
jgi:hypothetical protein